ncbi:DUF3127 domain-containing protein [Croceimicrobium sp.]|uniref:DUF3127 domain-containing protein n=1 Tax=Croceimicrobium sp. TaxID=2828340 RepID=UPI003BA8A92B
MEVSGIVKRVGGTQQISASFKKREVVVTTEEQYPQHISIEFVQDKTDLLDSVREGEKVTIGINLRGREWTSPQGEVKYFNTIQGWRIEKSNPAPAPSNPAPQGGAAPSTDFGTPPSMTPYEEDDDDLPF